MAGQGQLTKDFHIREFKCKDGTQVPDEFIPNVQELANNLQVLRDYISKKYAPGKPNGARLSLNSGYRTDKYNEKIGGSPKSQHKKAKAGDLVSEVLTPKKLASEIKLLIKQGKMKQGGVGIYPSFVHYDTRGTEARW